MALFDTTYLLDQIKIKATLPEGRYEDSEILNVAYDVLLSQLMPLILNLKEEYYVRHEPQAITANTASYPIPHRAHGLILREVKKLSGTSIVDLTRIDPTEVDTTSPGEPDSFYLEGHDVVLYPTPAATLNTLKLSYYITPSKPVQVSECAVITNIDTSTGIITATPPTTWTTADTFDFVSRRNGHKSLALDLSASSVTTTTLTFSTSDIPSSLAVGDYIALSGEAPFIQAPDNAVPLMIQMVANELLEDLGDQEALQVGLAKAENLKNIFTQTMSVRVLGAPKRSKIAFARV